MRRPSCLRSATALSLLLLFACSDDPSGPDSSPAIESVVLSPGVVELGVGGTVQMDAVALDSEGRAVPGQVFAWSAEGDALSVTADGRVRGEAPGEGRIVAVSPKGVEGSLPVLVSQGYASVTVSIHHTCALATTGEAFCWGIGQHGRLGGGDRQGDSPTPRPVVGGHRYTRLALGEHHTCGLTVEGRAYCWGANRFGTLGVGAEVDDSHHPLLVPLEVRLVDIAAGEDHTCALDESGQTYCWGRNHRGQLGSAAGSPCSDSTCVPTPTAVEGAAPLRALSIGSLLSTCGLGDAGAVYCWGSRTMLGTDEADERCTDLDCPVPMRVASGAAFRSVTMGYSHVCGLDVAGTLHCWGPKLTPLPSAIEAPEPLAAVGTSDMDTRRTCGVAEGGTGYCFDLESGLGMTPVADPPLGDGWRSISSSQGFNQACGVASTHLTYCWGPGQPLTEPPERVPGPE